MFKNCVYIVRLVHILNFNFPLHSKPEIETPTSNKKDFLLLAKNSAKHDNINKLNFLLVSD